MTREFSLARSPGNTSFHRAPSSTRHHATHGSNTGRSALLASICLLLLMASSLPAAAGIVNMKFIGTPTSNQYSGVYTYPYDLKVNGGPNQWMMCISYEEHISVGETWKANVVNVGSLDPTAYPLDYEAAFLFKMAEADHGADPSINAAAWWLLDGAPSLNAPAHSLQLLAQSQTFSKGEFSDVLLYTPIAGSQSGDLGTPQAFLGATPEPGTLALFGSGVIGLSGLLRRRLRG